ncbi:uncharacterized protein LOC144653853 isoform X2 [Oculina patagonica]
MSTAEYVCFGIMLTKQMLLIVIPKRPNQLLFCWGINLSSEKRQRVHRSANLISTTSCFTVKMKWEHSIVFIFVVLVCRVGANFPCKPEQIHWNNTKGKSYKCLDCPDCPAGSQPSVACGSSVKYGTPVHCVSCELGKTYSNNYDNAQCKACTICSKGRAVKKNCTLFTNTKCDTKCGHGFYTFPLISSCLPCTQCCDDGKDEFATECMDNKNKCKVRHTACAHVQTVSSKPPVRSRITLPTTNTSEIKTKTGAVNKEENLLSDKLSTSITPTWSVDNKALKDETVMSGKQDGTSIVVIMLAVALAMCLVVSSLVIAKKFIPGRDFLRSSREQNSDNGGNNITQRQPPSRSQSLASHTSGQDTASSLYNRPESFQPNQSESPSSSGSASPLLNRPESSQSSRPESPKISGSAVSPLGSASPRADESTLPQPNGYTSSQPCLAASAQSRRSSQEQDKSNLGDVTLEELEDNNMELFDWVCTRLDNGRVTFRRDYERLASKYKKISTEARNSLRNESLSEGRSPSKLLMSLLQTTYPHLPLRHFVKTLKDIGRNDIAHKLTPHMRKNAV